MLNIVILFEGVRNRKKQKISKKHLEKKTLETMSR